MVWRRRWFGAFLLLLQGLGSCRNGSEPVASSDPDRARPQASPSTPPATSAAPSELAAKHATPPQPAPSAERPWPPAPPAVTSDFCIEGVSALDEETCYALPAAPTGELLLYLHGIVPPEKASRQKTNFETVVQNASRRAGVAALMPRGELGLAPKGHADWWGWPTTASAHEKWSSKLLAKLKDKRHALEALVGRPFTRLYVAGSSSGAYYAIQLALSGDLTADGFAALSGATRINANLTGLRPRPFYIGYGSMDTVGGAAQGLAEALRKAGWPVQVAEHRLPHGTAEVYLDEAFAFWRAHLTEAAK
jgi:predicted esterase